MTFDNVAGIYLELRNDFADSLDLGLPADGIAMIPAFEEGGVEISLLDFLYFPHIIRSEGNTVYSTLCSGAELTYEIILICFDIREFP